MQLQEKRKRPQPTKARPSVEPPPNPFTDALIAEAKEAGLRYASDKRPGLQRKLVKDKFIYNDASGKVIRDQPTLARIKRLAIPPAWVDVWISPRANDHIQATGRDARGRKQYRYHADWRQQRDENKFGHMQAFAKALPVLRRRVKRDMALRGMPRAKVLATVVRLLEATLIRVGNDEYARQNGSYGLTTMRNRHVRVRGSRIEFGFKGKSGKHHEINVADPQLARIVRRCQDIPGQDLFAYEDDKGHACDVTSQDVNDYLREANGENFTAKDFRTWAGTVLAAIALRECQIAAHKTQAKRNITTAIEAVAQTLGNTPAVCRKSYVHPAILDSYLLGVTIDSIGSAMTGTSRLRSHESAVLSLLQKVGRT